MFATALLYMMMHYITLSRRSAVHRYGGLIALCVAAIGVIVAVATKNIRLALSSILWHAALFSVVYSLEDIISNRRRFRPAQFFRTGGALFSIFFTLSFITAFIGRNQHFTLNCETLNGASNSVINFTERTFHIGNDDITSMKKDVIGNMIDNQVAAEQDTSIAGLMQSYKQQLIDETLSNQKNVNQKVCQVFLDQIKDLYEKPGFRVSVILLMFLVLSPLLRLSLFIISGVNIILFLALKA